MDFFRYRVLPVLLLLKAFVLVGPYVKEFTWKTVEAFICFLLATFLLIKSDYSNKPNEDEADVVNKKKTNKGQ